MVYLVNIQAFLRGFKLIRQNPVTGVFLFLRKGRFSLLKQASFKRYRQEQLIYKHLLNNHIEPYMLEKALVIGADMLSPLLEYRQEHRIKVLPKLVEADAWILEHLKTLLYRYQIAASTILPPGKFNLILAHAYRVADFEMAETLLAKLTYGKIILRFDTGNLSGLNQFEKLRVFFSARKELLVSTFPFDENSDMLIVEKKKVSKHRAQTNSYKFN